VLEAELCDEITISPEERRRAEEQLDRYRLDRAGHESSATVAKPNIAVPQGKQSGTAMAPKLQLPGALSSLQKR